jgi:succinate dehydrogenase/fumarate reductase-like Fe-S protein
VSTAIPAVLTMGKVCPKHGVQIMATHRIPCKTKIAPISPGSTVGKMRAFRKIVRDECVDLLDVIGAGVRFNTPIPASRRIGSKT